MEPAIIFFLTLYFLAVLYKPHWGIYAILALLPAYQIRFDIFRLPSTFLEWMVLLLSLALIVRIASRRGRGFPPELGRIKKIISSDRWLFIFAGMFIVAGLIAVFVSPERIKALGIFKAYFAEGIVFWLLFQILIDSQAKLRNAVCALGLLVIALAVFGIYQFFTLSHLPPSWWGPGIEPRRVVSFYTYPNAVSLLITPILAWYTSLILFYREIKTRIPKKFLWLVLAFGLVLLVLTFSRGAWIGYAAAVCFLALLSPYRKWVAMALALGIALIAAVPATRLRIMPALAGTDPAGLERLKLWHTASVIIKEQPLFGAGLMGFRDWYAGLRQNLSDDVLNYPHNFFLNFWVETGLLGLISVVGLIILIFQHGLNLLKSNIELRPWTVGVMAAWVALVVHGQLDAPFFKNDLALLFWMLAAIIPVLQINLLPEHLEKQENR